MLKALPLVYFIFFCGYFLSAQQTVGLFKNDSTAFNGYTLFAPTAHHTTYLIDNCGEVVNTWMSNYNPGIVAYLLEDGHLLRTANISNPAFVAGGSGGGLELFNWEGDLVWSYEYSNDLYHQHHDVEMLENGNILVLAWEFISQEEAITNGRENVGNGGLWSEQVVELERIGTDSAKIVWEWRLWDHLIQETDSSKLNFGIVAHHPQRMDLNFPPSDGGMQGGVTDWMHFNSIDYHAGLDQILLSSRNSHEIYIIDHSTSTAEAATNSGGQAGKGGDFLYRWGNPQAYQRGAAADQQFFGQHDAHWIPEGRLEEGKIMVFNNGIERPQGQYSSIDIIAPVLNEAEAYDLDSTQAFLPQEIFWSYMASTPNNFYSRRMSGAQRLPNGNILVCEGSNGRFFEIGMDRQIVWDYINPIRQGGPVSQGNTISSNNVFRAYRYGGDYPAFENKDLTPMGVLEVNPLPSDCQIYDGTISSTQRVLAPSSIIISPNPANSQVSIKWGNAAPFTTVTIFDILGREWVSLTNINTIENLDISDWKSGIYFIKIGEQRIQRLVVQ